MQLHRRISHSILSTSSSNDNYDNTTAEKEVRHRKGDSSKLHTWRYAGRSQGRFAIERPTSNIVDNYGRPGERRRKRVFVRTGEKCDNYIYYLFMHAIRLYIMSLLFRRGPVPERWFRNGPREPRRPLICTQWFCRNEVLSTRMQNALITSSYNVRDN